MLGWNFHKVNDKDSRSMSKRNEMASFPANIYLFKVNNRNTRKRCEICSKLTTKTLEWRQWRRSGVFMVNFEHFSYIFLVFLLPDLEKVNVCWVLVFLLLNLNLFNKAVSSWPRSLDQSFLEGKGQILKKKTTLLSPKFAEYRFSELLSSKLKGTGKCSTPYSLMPGQN